MRCCRTCRHFVDEPVAIERALTGLTILSSAQGDTWGDQGICRVHDQMLLPTMSCARWRALAAAPAQQR